MANTLKFGDGKWATGEGTALAFNDENDNFKPLPFTFTRASKATVVNQSGLIEEVGNDVPRIDFKDNTKGALLLEPSRSNLLTYSEDFSNSNWINQSTDTTLSLVSGGSPDGGAFYRCTSGSSGGGRIVDVYSGSLTGGLFSIYAKGSGSLRIDLFINGGGNVIKNITLTSEWKRYEVHNPQTNTLGDVSIRFFANSVADIYGAQLETGSYATSYIPTSGSAVTRVADAASQTLPSSVFNSYPFSVFAEVDVVNITSGYAFSLLNKASSNQYFTIEYYSNRWHIVARPSGSTVTRSSSEVLTKGTHKLVGVYTDTNLKLFLNGSLIASGSNTQSFNSSIDSMLLGQLRISGDTGSRNSVTQALLYNTELTDQEAITLTT